MINKRLKKKHFYFVVKIMVTIIHIFFLHHAGLIPGMVWYAGGASEEEVM